jgi:transmembrane sensor
MTPNNRKARLLLKKYLQGKCTPEEVALLHKWYDQLPESSAGDVGISDSRSLEEQLRQATWNKIIAQQAPVRRLNYRVAAAAAVIGILVLSGGYWFHRYSSSRLHEFNNQTASVSRIVLPDSSVVWLNAHSRLKWRNDFASADRAVMLDGEGYFDVTKDAAHPFRVSSNGVVTDVLGTEFNVEGYSGESAIRVALVKGSVGLRSLDGHHVPVILKPGQIAQVDAAGQGTVDVLSGDAVSYGAWTTGGFILQNVPLESALQRLCHKYGYALKVSFSDDRRKPISASYRNDSFEEILAGLLYINHLNYTIKDSVISVY